MVTLHCTGGNLVTGCSRVSHFNEIFSVSTTPHVLTSPSTKLSKKNTNLSDALTEMTRIECEKLKV